MTNCTNKILKNLYCKGKLRLFIASNIQFNVCLFDMGSVCVWLTYTFKLFGGNSK